MNRKKQLSPIIIALDFPNKNLAIDFAKTVDPEQVRLKVGKELFVNSGPAIIDELQQLGFEIFLDLKFHDIPNTVAKACIEAAKLGVWMTNIHASGGDKMMRQVVKELTALADSSNNAQFKKPLITAVTILTSMDQQTLGNLGIPRTIAEQVTLLATLAKNNGIDGVVCSAQEAKMLRDKLGDDFILVTPGIRLETDNNDDQHRVMTPKKALKMGSNYLVIGRPITMSDNPQATIEHIISTIS